LITNHIFHIFRKTDLSFMNADFEILKSWDCLEIEIDQSVWDRISACIDFRFTSVTSVILVSIEQVSSVCLLRSVILVSIKHLCALSLSLISLNSVLIFVYWYKQPIAFLVLLFLLIVLANWIPYQLFLEIISFLT